MEELNTKILIPWCERMADLELVPHTTEPVAQVYERERAVLHPLPLQPFEACRIQAGKVSKISTVTFDTNQYSVPSQYAGQTVWVKGFIDLVIIVAQNEVIAEHKRCRDRQQMVLDLDHYLDVLLKKPRAVRDARVMHSDQVPEVFRRVHAKMRERQEAEGDRLFVRFLLLHREGMSMTIDLLLAYHLKQLRLPTMAKQYASLAREAVEHGLSYEAYLLALVEQETATREENQRQLRLRHATFPIQKTLDTFEFHQIPSFVSDSLKVVLTKVW